MDQLPVEHKCHVCGKPIPAGVAMVHCEPGFYPREDPDLFQDSEEVGVPYDLCLPCARKGIGLG